MRLTYSATTQIQQTDINYRVFIDESFGVHQRAANRYASRLEVIEITVLEALWYAGLGEQDVSAGVGLAAARSYAFAFDGFPSGSTAVRARRKLYI